MITEHWKDAVQEISHEVHVWRAVLDVPAAVLQEAQAALSPDEQCRAKRFRLPRDRQRYIAARGLLRILLGRYLGCVPSRLCLSYGPYGKPFLPDTPDHQGLQFNVSHSHGLALYAVARDRQVGIDVEQVRPMANIGALAERFFSARESTALRALPPDVRQEAFFTCWTRKEAYIKARGEGLSFPLDAFEVSFLPGEPAALLRTRGDPREAARWALQDLSVGPGYKAALAAEGNEWRLACRKWPA